MGRMPKMVISYRRADSQDIAMRIRDRLAARYGKRSVFTDIDSIPLGRDFLRHINSELSTSDVLLAVVGPRWIRGGGEQGQGIGEETDYVRIEVEGALKRDMPVIPILVGGAKMPKPAELPEGLRAFAYRNAAAVDSGVNFQNDMDRLIRSLDEEFAARSGGQPPTATEATAEPPHEQAAVERRRSDRGSVVTQTVDAFRTARDSVPAVGFAIGAAGVAALAALAIAPFGYARAAGI